ncbi:Histones H3 and H4 [Halanaeroarchaeum sp. HSR-CO]|uniref:histone n=1 Tax=Halanaeroarchaeum sp. HSR-CO TaxID=2866382 RepID=UPI00217CCEB4|nr:histone [Halanaeroarchaeum sp. HSR-CO]UWG47065.1 Histones H3 and H4 [Halanaeroarchaeum sp. HSR-CO]
MSVELPVAPVDTLIRRQAGDLRVSKDAAEELARRIQERGASLAAEAAEGARADGRKTLMVEDFSSSATGDESVTLPVAPVDRIARLDIPPEFRVAADARVALAAILEEWAADVADGARVLAEHAGRRTIQAEDIQTYLRLVE